MRTLLTVLIGLVAFVAGTLFGSTSKTLAAAVEESKRRAAASLEESPDAD